jgi:hypothetical protein
MATRDSSSIEPFPRDDLGGDAGRDQRVESADGPAGDGDEAEGEKLAANHQALALDGEVDKGGHLELGQHGNDARGEGTDGAQLHEGGEVVTGSQQQPDRQDRGRQSIHDQ